MTPSSWDHLYSAALPSWEYAPDYYATFFEDPDGIRLKVMNFREIGRKVMYNWEARAGL